MIQIIQIVFRALQNRIVDNRIRYLDPRVNVRISLLKFVKINRNHDFRRRFRCCLPSLPAFSPVLLKVSVPVSPLLPPPVPPIHLFLLLLRRIIVNTEPAAAGKDNQKCTK